jgi:short-subunit dehydrogenase
VYAGARDIAALDAPWSADPRVQLIRIDVTDPASIDEAAAKASDTAVLINNAGTLRFGGALDGDLATYQADLDTNLFGTVRVTRAFAPNLVNNSPGAVVNISSIIALAPARGMVGYSISKAAVHSFSQGLRAELRDSGVDVVGVYPAQIDTDMLKGVEADKASPELVAERIVRELRAGAQEIYLTTRRRTWRAFTHPSRSAWRPSSPAQPADTGMPGGRRRSLLRAGPSRPPHQQFDRWV